MNIYKKIYHALIIREHDINFSKKLQLAGVSGINKSILSIYKTSNTIKIPWIEFENIHQKESCKKRLQQENLLSTLFYCITIISIFLISYLLIHSGSENYIFETVSIICLCAIFFASYYGIVKSQVRKESYYDVLNSTMLCIINLNKIAQQDNISDNDLIILLKDIKNCKKAINTAKKYKFSIHETDFESHFTKNIVNEEELNKWDDESRHNASLSA